MNKIQLDEYQECVILADYLRLLQQQGKIEAFTHIPNSTYTESWNQKRRNKRIGVAPGVPDFMIVCRRGLLFIEMKKAKGGVISATQKAWLKYLEIAGIKAEVCAGFDQAKVVIDNFI